jgi:hypothetical protein
VSSPLFPFLLSHKKTIINHVNAFPQANMFLKKGYL